MKLTRSRLLIAATVIPAALVATTPSPASAAIGPSALVGTLTGAGNITPGLDIVPTAQTFSFSGTAAVSGSLHGSPFVGQSQYLTVTASGLDLLGSDAEGMGTIVVDVASYDTLYGVFVRVGGVAHVSVFANNPGPSVTEANGDFVFIPGQFPTTSYTVVGAVSLTATY